MLAAQCSELPQELKHLIHVLALNANNVTGRGLTGQATLGRYLGCGDRNVRKLLARLQAAWEAGDSPVGVLRSKRWLNSDAYQIVVREGAPLRLEREGDDRNSSSANDRNPRAGMTGTTVPHDRNSSSNQPEPQFQKRGMNRNPSSYKLRSLSTERTPEIATPEKRTTQGGPAPASASQAAGDETAELGELSPLERSRARARAAKAAAAAKTSERS